MKHHALDDNAETPTTYCQRQYDLEYDWEYNLEYDWESKPLHRSTRQLPRIAMYDWSDNPDITPPKRPFIGLTYQEIGDILGVTKQCAQINGQRALRKLRAFVQQHNIQLNDLME